MKRSWIAVACVSMFVLGGAAVFAASSSTLTVQPSEMTDGETKTFTDGAKTITVRREGDTMTVRIDKAGETERLTITREGNRIRIGHAGNVVRFGDLSELGDLGTGVVVTPDRLPRLKPLHETSTFFVCPNDRTMLRVPEAKKDQTFQCPVDGTKMEKRKGRGFTFFFDDSVTHL